MPPSKLGIGVGLAEGAEKFMQSFMQAKQFKLQQTLAKNAPAIQALMDVIKDPNTSYKSKADAMDAIPHLSGAKVDIPLSQQTGYRRLLDEKVLTDDEKPGTPSRIVTDQNAINYNNQTEQNNKNTSALNQELGRGSSSDTNPDGTLNPTGMINPSIIDKGVTGSPAIYAQRGDLSPNDITELKQRRLSKAANEDEFSRQYRLAQVDAGIKSKALAAQGWKSNDTWAYDSEKKVWQQQWTNPITKESFMQSLPSGMVPEDVIKKQIQAGGSSGVSKAYTTLKQSYATMMNLDINDPKVEMATAKNWEKNFQATIDVKEANATGTNLTNKGQKPPTIDQTIDNATKKQDQLNAAQKEIDEQDRQEKLSRVEVDHLAKDKGDYNKGTGAWGDYAQAEKELKAFQGSDAAAAREANPAEYSRLENNWRTAKYHAEDLERQYTVAEARRSSFKQATIDAQGRFDKISGGKSDGSNSSKLDLSKFSKPAQAYIQAHVDMPAFGGDLNKLLKAYKTQFGKDLK